MKSLYTTILAVFLFNAASAQEVISTAGKHLYGIYSQQSLPQGTLLKSDCGVRGLIINNEQSLHRHNGAKFPFFYKNE